MNKFIQESVNEQCKADFLQEGDVDQCKACAQNLKELNTAAEKHHVAAKAAIKQHTKQVSES